MAKLLKGVDSDPFPEELQSKLILRTCPSILEENLHTENRLLSLRIMRCQSLSFTKKDIENDDFEAQL
jgi:hypothetical protein